MSTSERLERLRSGLQKSVRGDTRRVQPAGAQEERRTQRMRDFAADLGALSSGAAQTPPAATPSAPAQDDPEDSVGRRGRRAGGWRAQARAVAREIDDDLAPQPAPRSRAARSAAALDANPQDYAPSYPDDGGWDDDGWDDMAGARDDGGDLDDAFERARGALDRGPAQRYRGDEPAGDDAFAGYAARASYEAPEDYGATSDFEDGYDDMPEAYDAYAEEPPAPPRRRPEPRGAEPDQADSFEIGGWYEEDAPAAAPPSRGRGKARRAAAAAAAATTAEEPRRRPRRPAQAEAADAVARSRKAEASKAAPKPSRGAGAFGALERSIAWRYLRARREEGFISVIAFLSLLGITLGVATLIIVMSVMNGFRAELVEKIIGVNAHITILPLDRELEDYERIADTVERIPGVSRAAPVIEAQVFASSTLGGAGAMVRGLRPGDMLSLDGVSVEPERARGSLLEFASGRGIAIGEGLARRLGVVVGDSIKLISPRGAVTPFGVTPRSRSYDVIYVFKTGMFGFDDAVMFLPLAEAQSFFNRDGVVDAIESNVATPESLDVYRRDIEAAVDAPIAIRDWQQANSGIIGALKTEATVMFVILSLLILLAALIIISGLVMLVKEKGRGVAILRTMGLSRGAVMRIFFLCGATIGVVGTVLGVGLGVVFTLNIQEIKAGVEAVLGVQLFPETVYGLSSLPARLMVEDVVLTISVALGLSFLATIYPAWRAARLDPVEALRYE